MLLAKKKLLLIEYKPQKSKPVDFLLNVTIVLLQAYPDMLPDKYIPLLSISGLFAMSAQLYTCRLMAPLGDTAFIASEPVVPF